MSTPRAANAPAPAERLLSLDVLRGVTIAFMILVNNQGSPHAFTQLEHAAWNGFTLTDLVFPTFLLLVGITTVLSVSSRLARGASKIPMLWQTVRRATLLFLFGQFLNNFPFNHPTFGRVYGVLPRIAVCYLIVTVLYIQWPTWKDKVVLAVALLVGYWALMRFVPVPGFGVPTHEIPINDPMGNLASWIDRSLFEPNRLYRRTTDPCGLLSTLPAIATALFGVLTGVWIRSTTSIRHKAQGLAVAGIGCVVTGLAWGTVFPINKNLWTSSYTLVSGGLTLLLLALSIYIVDIKRIGRNSSGPREAWWVCLVFGTNAIAAYMVSELVSPLLNLVHLPGGNPKTLYFHWLQQLLPAYGWAELLFGLTMVAITWIVIYALYRKRIFLKV